VVAKSMLIFGLTLAYIRYILPEFFLFAKIKSDFDLNCIPASVNITELLRGL